MLWYLAIPPESGSFDKTPTVLQRYFSPILRVNNNPNRCRHVSSVQKHPPVSIGKVIHFNFLLCIISPVKFIVDPVPCNVPCTVEKSAKKLFLQYTRNTHAHLCPTLVRRLCTLVIYVGTGEVRVARVTFTVGEAVWCL